MPTPRKLIVTCDGTWNTADDKDNDIPAPTNVVRLYNCLAKTDAHGGPQLKYYHPGVGTDGSTLERFAGGAYGLGISRNIMSAYRWLAENYRSGDEIYLFGFSRGAYTARSLAGFIGCCGLLDLKHASVDQPWERIRKAYEDVYRGGAKPEPATWPQLADAHGHTTIKIKFIGVWDTVGSLGIPDDLGLLNLFDDPKKWQFHDTQLGDHIELARHAVAIDEMRSSFTPTFWTDQNENVVNDGHRVVQLWFPGVHSDVGGGYAHCGLSDIALKWMIDEAAAAGLAFDPRYTAQIHPDPLGLLHDSLGGAFKALHTRPRNRPPLEPNSPHYHPSAWDRDAVPPITQSPYHHPTVHLAVGQSSEPINIYAREQWNETGLYLEAGATYQFTATGEWVDKTIACGPAGNVNRKFSPREIGQLVGTAIGRVESLFRFVTDNSTADFIGSRRDEKHPWFALIGAIANDGPMSEQGKPTVNPHGDGSPYPHQTFLIGQGCTLTINPTEEGYLYAFANDAWHFYGNNRGSVTLTVKRL